MEKLTDLCGRCVRLSSIGQTELLDTDYFSRTGGKSRSIGQTELLETDDFSRTGGKSSSIGQTDLVDADKVTSSNWTKWIRTLISVGP